MFNNIEIFLLCSEYQRKVNLVDREEDDSVEYSSITTWFFNPKLSSPLTGEEELVIPHLFIVGMVKLILKYQPKAVGMLSNYRHLFSISLKNSHVE